MKLLIVTQAVDTEDRALGFFHQWIGEFAKRAECVQVICLKEGKHELPSNVSVRSLGKEGGASRVKYIFNFYRHIWRARREYDIVFVHMNEEYVLLGGLFWRMAGKRVVLWRNHKKGSVLTRVAGFLAHSVCYTSPEAYVAGFNNAHKMPIGIDTHFFVPPASPSSRDAVLFLGRIDPVKKVEVFVEALTTISTPFHADLYGSPTEPDSQYAKGVLTRAKSLIDKGVLAVRSGVPYERTRALYQAHAIYVNLTPSGSFDKTIGEAMASGCIVVAVNDAVRGTIHPAMIVRDGDAADVARGIGAAIDLSDEERSVETHGLRAYVEKNHSLQRLMAGLYDELTGA